MEPRGETPTYGEPLARVTSLHLQSSLRKIGSSGPPPFITGTWSAKPQRPPYKIPNQHVIIDQQLFERHQNSPRVAILQSSNYSSLKRDCKMLAAGDRSMAQSCFQVHHTSHSSNQNHPHHNSYRGLAHPTIQPLPLPPLASLDSHSANKYSINSQPRPLTVVRK